VNIELHIERLVLDGFDFSGHEAGAIGSAVQRELASTIGGWAQLPGALDSAPVLEGEPMTFDPGAGKASVGGGIALSICSAMSPTTRRTP
jgi:hypothetical protein